MVNYILIALIAAIIGGAGFYIHREKKKGAVCIGCPHAGSCGGKCGGSGGCSCH